MFRGLTLTLVASAAASVSNYSKIEVKTAYQAAKCCAKSFPQYVADNCVVTMPNGIKSGGAMVNQKYVDAGCCTDDQCSVAFDDCPICQVSAADLYVNHLGVQGTYTLANGLASSITTHTLDGIYSMDLIGTSGNTTQPFDFVVTKFPTATDPSWKVRIEQETQIPGCDSTKTFIVDEFDSVECGDFKAIWVGEFATKEKADTCMSVGEALQVVPVRLSDLYITVTFTVYSQCP